MGLLNRIGLLLLSLISSLILLTLAMISPKYYAIYLAYITDKVFKFLYGKEKSKV